MSLPEESVAANTLPEVTTIPTGKKLIFTDPDTNEGGIITLENLSKQILQNLTSQTFALDQGNLTLLQALNQLNSKTSTQEITIPKSGSVLKKCLNCLILIVGTNTQMYDLYACIGYQSDSVRSTIKLLTGAGNHKITYADNDTSESKNGIYTITNGSSNVDVKATIIPLQR